MKKLLSTVFISLALILCVAHGSAESVTDPGQAVPIQLVRGHIIVVRCSVGDIRDVTGIIDTGVSETVLDMALVRKLKLDVRPDQATFITQQAKVWAVAVRRLQLGPITADRLDGIATDLSSLTAETGIRPQVLIGMDFLRRSSFLIDYRTRRLVFGSALPFAQMPHSARLVTSRSGDSGGSEDSGLRFAAIESSIQGRTVRLQVDSGFDGLLVYRDRLPGSYAAVVARSGSESAHLANVSQKLTAHNFNSGEVRIGDWRAPRAPLTVVDGGGDEPSEFDGLIGTAFLSRTRVAFDFQKGIVSWE